MFSMIHIIRETVWNFITMIKTFGSEILIAVCVFLIIYQIVAYIGKRKVKYPPGPNGLPVVGYIPFLSKNIHLDFTELGKKYGGIFSLKLGSVNLVILNDVDAIQEALVNSELLGKPPKSDVSLIFEKSPFFSGDNIHRWKEHRKFVVQAMKDLGFGATKVESEMQEEIRQLVEVIQAHQGKPMDLNALLFTSVSNNISALVFGKRYTYSDPVRKHLNANMKMGTDAIAQSSILMYFPWIRYVPLIKNIFSTEKAILAFENIRNICKREIQEHKETREPNNIRDYIDRYLIEIESRQETHPDRIFSDETLAATALDLFTAGSNTVHTSLLWCFYIIAAYPDVQKKVQKEISDVIGSDRCPQFLDRKRMPYTHAVLLETLRWKGTIPLNLLRYSATHTSVRGYDIPPGVGVIANFWAVHHDPYLWEEPDTFVPERFLNSDGNSLIKRPNFMAFSIGRRSCPGEIMANIELFLYFTSILQKFDVVFPDCVIPTFSATLSVNYKVHDYMIKLIPKISP